MPILKKKKERNFLHKFIFVLTLKLKNPKEKKKCVFLECSLNQSIMCLRTCICVQVSKEGFNRCITGFPYMMSNREITSQEICTFLKSFCCEIFSASVVDCKIN